jgi:actin-related protein
MSDGGSLAGSRDADKIFKESVCRPEQRKLESLLGKVFGELTNMFNFKLSEYTLTDEDQQSIIDDRDIKNGSLLPDERRAKIGLPARPDGNGDQAIDIRSLQLLQQEMQQKLQDTQLKSQEKIAASNAKAQAAAKAAAPATGTKAPVKAVAKPAGAAQKKAEQKVAGNRAVNSQRSATRSNAPGAPATRNPKGSGRQSK